MQLTAKGRISWCVVLAFGCKQAPAVVDGGETGKVRVAAADGSISGPSMPGWKWMEDARSGDGFTLHELKWSRGEVYLYAKDYALTRDETMESLTTRDWRAFYAPLLSPIVALDVHPTTFASFGASRPAVAVHAEGEASALDEVFVPMRGHLLVTTAAGPRAELSTLAGDVTAWRGSITFAAAR